MSRPDLSLRSRADWNGVISVTANVGQTLNLALSDGTGNPTATSGVDYGTSLQYWNGSAWTAYSPGFTVPGTGIGSTTVLVRMAINQDTVFENAEDFKLKIRHDQRAGTFIDADTVTTMDEYFTTWIARRSRSIKPNSVRTYRSIYRIHISPAMGRKAVGQCGTEVDAAVVVGGDLRGR